MQNNIDEGLFVPDRNSKKIYGQDKEELQNKIDDLLSKYKDYKPKASNIKTDKLGRFFVDFSYQVNDKGNEETITNKISKGISKGKEIAGKVIDKTKEVIDKIPRQGTLTAPTGFKLGQEQAKFVKSHPDVVFRTKYKNNDGTWSIDYAARVQKNIKSTTSQDRINNIQKALHKLSDDKLKRIEDFIK